MRKMKMMIHIVFLKDCEKWYGKEIETITAIDTKYKSIKESECIGL